MYIFYIFGGDSMQQLLITQKSSDIVIHGKTNPFVGLCQNKNEYVVKHHNDSFEGYNLVSEFVSYYLGRVAGINIPDMKLGKCLPSVDAEVDTDLFLCSKYIKNCMPLKDVSIDSFSSDVNLIKIMVFDMIIMNHDRTFEDNILFSPSESKIYAIDHSHCFNGFKKLNKFKNRFDERILLNYSDALSNITLSDTEFEGIINGFSRITPSVISSIVDSIPSEWEFPYSDELKDFLEVRIEGIGEIVDIIGLNINVYSDNENRVK